MVQFALICCLSSEQPTKCTWSLTNISKITWMWKTTICYSVISWGNSSSYTYCNHREREKECHKINKHTHQTNYFKINFNKIISGYFFSFAIDLSVIFNLGYWLKIIMISTGYFFPHPAIYTTHFRNFLSLKVNEK